MKSIKEHLLIYWTFYKSTVTINLAVSLIICIIARSVTVFAVGLVTFGLFFAFLYKEVVRPHEYYFYYNQGISKIKLIIFCLFVNILPSALILIITHYVTSA